MNKKILSLFFLMVIAQAIYAQQSVPVIKWQKCYGGSGGEQGAIGPDPGGGGSYIKAFLADKDGGYLLAGSTTSVDGDISGNRGKTDIWVAKLDNAGTIIWSKTLGGSREEMVFSALLDIDGGYIIAGHTLSIDGDFTDNHGGNDAWLIKLDRNGNFIWKKCYGGTGYEAGNQIQLVGNSGYIFVSSSMSTDGDVSTNHGGMDIRCRLILIMYPVAV